ncbi:MAG: chemotaxis protein CheW [Spirochaetia bacterium]|jgi:purine-binding chemotaxis protein CheW
MGKRYVSFSLASGSYCIPVDQVLQILRLENLLEIPKPPPYVEGVINLRGEIIPVVNLRERLEIAPQEHAAPKGGDGRKRRVIIARLGTRSYGLDVDEVREIVDIDDAGITSDATMMFGARADFIIGIARRDEHLYMLLDLARVFSAGRDVPGALTGQG